LTNPVTRGEWAPEVRRFRWNLFPLRRGQTFHRLPVHSPWHPTNPGVRFKRIGVNLYHLKMIDERNRTTRRDLYEKLDPRAEIPIAGGRDYQPAYRDDYRLTQTGPPAQS
jgi:hypothetical protein